MTVLSFWTDKVPTAAWITIFWVVIILINVWAVKFFGEVEVVSSSIKFGWIIIVIISLIGERNGTNTFHSCSTNMSQSYLQEVPLLRALLAFGIGIHTPSRTDSKAFSLSCPLVSLPCLDPRTVL